MSKPFEEGKKEAQVQAIRDSMPSRESVQQSLNIPRQSTDRSEGLPRRRMIGGGSKLGIDAARLIEMGYSVYWRNDEDGRIQELLANGYEFVTSDEIEDTSLRIGATDMSKDKVSRVVGHRENGAPLTAYLMKIKAGWKQENDAFYQQRCDKIDAAIRSGKTVPVEEGYVPDGGISYSRSR